MAPIDVRKKLDRIKRIKNINSGTSTTNTQNKNGNVRDLRQLILKKKKPQSNNERSPNRVARITNARPSFTTNGQGASTRESRDTQKQLVLRRGYQVPKDNNRTSLNRSDRATHGPNRSAITSVRTRSINNSSQFRSAGQKLQQQQYYVPPHMQHQQPTYIIAPAAPAPVPAPQSNLAMDNVPQAQGASILVSNLLPTITQSDIIELFGGVGILTAVNMINPTTALVTYRNSSDAVSAVRLYHNRTLDDKPMSVHMMPNSTPSSNVRSRIGHAMSSQAIPMEVSYGGRLI